MKQTHKVNAKLKDLQSIGLDFLEGKKVKLIQKRESNSTCEYFYGNGKVRVNIPSNYLEKI